MRIVPNSLTKKANISLIATKAKDLAREIEEYFFGKKIEDNGDEVNVREILRPMREDAESHKPDFQALSRKDRVIAILSRHLRVVSVVLKRLNDADDENVNELLKSAGI